MLRLILSIFIILFLVSCGFIKPSDPKDYLGANRASLIIQTYPYDGVVNHELLRIYYNPKTASCIDLSEGKWVSIHSEDTKLILQEKIEDLPKLRKEFWIPTNNIMTIKLVTQVSNGFSIRTISFIPEPDETYLLIPHITNPATKEIIYLLIARIAKDENGKMVINKANTVKIENCKTFFNKVY